MSFAARGVAAAAAVAVRLAMRMRPRRTRGDGQIVVIAPCEGAGAASRDAVLASADPPVQAEPDEGLAAHEARRGSSGDAKGAGHAACSLVGGILLRVDGGAPSAFSGSGGVRCGGRCPLHGERQGRRPWLRRLERLRRAARCGGGRKPQHRRRAHSGHASRARHLGGVKVVDAVPDDEERLSGASRGVDRRAGAVRQPCGECLSARRQEVIEGAGPRPGRVSVENGDAAVRRAWQAVQ